MAVYLLESKEDKQKLINHVGEDTANLFFSLKDRLKSPENDIYYWLKKEPGELENRLNDLQSTKTRSQKDEEASKGAELLYDEDGWKVYHITTYEASAKYGKNTQWCITGSKRWSNGERGEEYFNDYTRRGIQFYFYIKDNGDKYALALAPRINQFQVFNAIDEDVSHRNLSFLPNVEGLPKFRKESLSTVQQEDILVYTNGMSKSQYQNAKYIITAEDVTSIDVEAFSKCTSLEAIEIGDSVEEIGHYAFSGCTSLKSIKLSNSLSYIPIGMCTGCTSLESIEIPEGVKSLDGESFRACTSLRQVRLPSSVKIIDFNVFEQCTSLESIDLPESLRGIGKAAFKGCTALTNITIPDSVTVIRSEAFEESGLLGIDLEYTGIKRLSSKVFANCSRLEAVITPFYLSTIESEAFYSCYALKGVAIYNSVVHISDDAFEYSDNCIIYTDNEYVQDYVKESNNAESELQQFHWGDSLECLSLDDWPYTDAIF